MKTNSNLRTMLAVAGGLALAVPALTACTPSDTAEEAAPEDTMTEETPVCGACAPACGACAAAPAEGACGACAAAPAEGACGACAAAPEGEH